MSLTRSVFVLILTVSVLATAADKSAARSVDDAVYLVNRGQYSQAAELFEQLSAKDPMAAFFLGELYVTGRGVARDRASAAKWFDLADRQTGRKGKASYDMAWESMHGAIGLPPDYQEAQYWIEKAALAGHPQAKPLSELLSHVAQKCREMPKQ